MNRRFFLLLPLICIAITNTNAQQDRANIEVIYKQVIRHTPSYPDGAVDINFVMLSIDGNHAVAQDYAAYQTDSVRAIKSSDQKTIQKYVEQEVKAVFYFDPKVVQNAENQTLTIYDIIIPERFYYIEPFMSTWQVADGNKEIVGYECSKATIDYGGRHWTVWYSEDLPLPFGPWKLAGLPGLILSASDESGEVSFELTELRSGRSRLPVVRADKNTTKTNRDAFVERKNAVMKNPTSNINTSSITQMSVLKNADGSSVMTINGDMPLRINPNGYIPLEK